MKGTCVRWTDRGFGFVKPDDGSEDIFCHHSAITDGNALSDGAQVEYERDYDDSRKKYRAINVTGGCTKDQNRRDDRRYDDRRDDRRYDDRRDDRRDRRSRSRSRSRDRGRDRYDDRRRY